MAELDELAIQTNACCNLIKTYDCNYLNSMDTDLKKSFYDKVTGGKYCFNTVKRPVLAKLIDNHLNDEKAITIYPFIGGPNSLTVHYSKEFKKTIYVFGEFHNKEINCSNVAEDDPTVDPMDQEVHIEDFLFTLLQTTDTFLDIFIESNPLSSTIRPLESANRLTKLYNQLKKCIIRDSRHDPECLLGRVHWIDTRDGSELSMFTSLYFHDLLNNAISVHIPDSERIVKLEELVDRYKEVFEEIQKLHYISDRYDYFSVKITTNSINVKEFTDTIVHRAIKKFLMNELLTTISDFERIIEAITFLLAKTYSIESDDSKKHYQLRETLTFVSYFLLQIDIINMDYYALLRMFKDFRVDDEQKPAFDGAIIGDQPKKAYNIIIYAGSCHSSRYRRCLKYLGFKMYEKIGDLNKEETCINMKDIIMPFFQTSEIISKDEIDVDLQFIYDHPNIWNNTTTS